MKFFLSFLLLFCGICLPIIFGFCNLNDLRIRVKDACKTYKRNLDYTTRKLIEQVLLEKGETSQKAAVEKNAQIMETLLGFPPSPDEISSFESKFSLGLKFRREIQFFIDECCKITDCSGNSFHSEIVANCFAK